MTVAEDVLSSQGAPYFHHKRGTLIGWEADPDFLITASDGIHRSLLPAVWAACARFARIDENGSELEPWEMNGETYTPNFISDPEVLSVGIRVWGDTKGFLTVGMGEAMVRVLTGELSGRRLTGHVAAPGPEVKTLPREKAPAPDPAVAISTEEDAAERYWFMARAVRATAANGRRYYDVEYRRRDGTWTRRRSKTEKWTANQRATIIALCHQLREHEDAEHGDTYGVATGLLLPDDPSVEPWPMPPDGLREPDPEAG